MFKSLTFTGIVIMLLVSCSQLSTENSHGQSLLVELQSFNEQMLEKHPQTKSFGSFCAVAGADFVGTIDGFKRGLKLGFRIGSMFGKGAEGAILGAGVMGLVCGVGSSYLAYRDVSEPVYMCQLDTAKLMKVTEYGVTNIKTARIQVNQGVKCEEKLVLPQKAIDVGVLHNYVLERLIDDSGVNVDSESLGQLDSAILHSNEFRAEMASALESYEKNGVTLDSSSLPDKVIQLYQQVFEACADSYDDLALCINTYHDIVEDSQELTENEKLSVYCSLSVSLYSLNYWKSNEEQLQI